MLETYFLSMVAGLLFKVEVLVGNSESGKLCKRQTVLFKKSITGREEKNVIVLLVRSNEI